MFPSSSSSLNSFSYSYSYPPMFKEVPNTNHEDNPNPNPNYPSFFFPSANSPPNQNNISSVETTHFVSQSLENIDNLDINTKEKPALRLTKQKRKSINDGENPNSVKNPRKKTGKSDRHSKIYTEKGPRDRRMRLSVPIARKFFDLQDILGFDKASKTIEWLFCQSKDAIEELVLSKCGNDFEDVFKLGDKNDELGKVVQVFSQSKLENKTKARAIARERTTSEVCKGIASFEGNPKIYEEEEQVSYGSLDQEKYFPLQEVGMIEKNFVGATSSSASNSIFYFDKDFSMSGGVDSSNSLMGIFENLDMVMVPWAGNIVQGQNPTSDSLIEFHSYFP